jgi:putative membrane protein
MADQPDAPAGAGGDKARTGMAAERTWLAWWRTGLAATAGALAVGRIAPQLLHAARTPYVILGCLYAALAVALLIVGARRQRGLQRELDGGEPAPLPFTAVAAFTVVGVVLVLLTAWVVIARS